MKTIPYSIVCEDAAHYFFVRQLLSIHSRELEFQINDECFNRYKCSTRSQVVNRYADIANQILRDEKFAIQLLIVMIDYDDKPLHEFDDYYKKRKQDIFHGVRDKVIISIPVRCVEHWLRQLQIRLDNPKSTKNESVENEKRLDSKFKVYGTKSPSHHKTESKIKELLKTEHITWLASRSASFNHFYEQVRKLSSH